MDKNNIDARKNQEEKIFACAKLLTKYDCNECDFKTDLKIALKEHRKQNCLQSEESTAIQSVLCEHCGCPSYSTLGQFLHIKSCESGLKWFACDEVKMPLTAAERQRRYKQKLKLNPDKYEESKKKKRENYHKKKKLVKDCTPKEKYRARIMWKLKKRNQRQRNKNH